ncbi:hypothetical protein BDB00DRAFT_932869 [Zychaea mexicana]|uniref:uncharacterized protein n=1 Tax=Zychaea mexicana TaxID=64656 RepID=UPI0022FEC2F9|nr:uncharacterized protein BDB00DRAFT_932869 [Zychaea mexicana]KAI9488264.1 hypothetical protein BDB00DRAFT_932869 [Zychaea mexicana]
MSLSSSCYKATQSESIPHCQYEKIAITMTPTARQRRQLVCNDDDDDESNSRNNNATHVTTMLRVDCTVCVEYPQYPYSIHVFALEDLDVILDQGLLTHPTYTLDQKSITAAKLSEALLDPSNITNEFLCAAIFQLFCDRVAPIYPLVFSPEYRMKLAELTRYIPPIAQSIHNLITRQQSHDHQHHHKYASETSKICLALIQATAASQSSRALRPISDQQNPQQLEDDTWTNVVIALYCYFKGTLPFPKYEKIKGITVSTTETSFTAAAAQQRGTPTPYESVVDRWTQYDY